MGSEGGRITERFPPVHVAVGRNVKEGKSLLAWAAMSFPGARVCLVHVHQPAASASHSNGVLSGSKLKNQAIKAFERLKMQKHMNQYIVFLSQMGIQADKVWVEMKNIEQGILQLITTHGITRLVMGAAAESFSPKLQGMQKISSKAMVVCQQAPISCHIWFISKGCLVHERPMHGGHRSTATTTSSPSTNGSGTAANCHSKDNMVTDDGKDEHCEHQTMPAEESTSKVNQSESAVLQTRGFGSSPPPQVESPGHLARFPNDGKVEHLEHQTGSAEESASKVNQSESVEHFEHQTESAQESASKVNRSESELLQSRGFCSSPPPQGESPGCLTRSSSSTSLDSEFQAKEMSYQIKLKESLRLWRAEENALEATQKAEAAESRWKEELNRRKEIEGQLVNQNHEIETMKNQHDLALKELRLIDERKPVLESRLREAHCSEQELEEKIIQAVNLLISFKAKRDEFQRERDSAIRKINKHQAMNAAADPFGTFEIPFSDIIEATENFSSSQKIGGGVYGSVFKGTINHLKVAIKMLPSSGTQTDWEFKNEAEILCRVRHPNLVTIVGVCPESRSLVYEYIENGSLEDHLSSTTKTHSLSWQARIRIAADICSALIFLHANDSCSVHGNLKPSNVLLDGNFVTKVSDFGIHNLSLVENYGTSIFTPESDIYSFGVVLLRLLTARPASTTARDVRCAIKGGYLDTVLDMSAGDWPFPQAKQLASLALRCCRKDPSQRPDLRSEVSTVLESVQELCNSAELTPTLLRSDSRRQRKIPSHFVCPIYQEVMKDPHIAPDGFTYEGEAIKGWFNSGHKTSPMTNLKLENCDLLPNYALYYAIQEWQLNTT
ncbi:U-box domain-containing protein 32 isoform X2 [Andrographis paniculata]|uniref:U-box domain-containing protein 32 isoform X2 n=1 Tax=Andrographis paniculata TaxID=175694 RepID=UPI0021E7C42F|nr:U-box domain-containing protein 32 isoform X2 [Andrographis paniculata]